MSSLENITNFMLESNKIEREEGLNPADIHMASLVATEGFKDLKDILAVHRKLTQHLKVNWSGKWRTVDVSVGGWHAPSWFNVPELMAQYIEQFPYMNSWEAHNKFEKIHPFQDFNGRMGRLIWLSKALDEGYSFTIPFLQMYYYQTIREQ